MASDHDHPATDPANTRPVTLPHRLVRAAELALESIAAAIEQERLVSDVREQGRLLRASLNSLDNVWPLLPEVTDDVTAEEMLRALARALKRANQASC